MSKPLLFNDYSTEDYVKFAEQTANWIKTTGKAGRFGKLWNQSPDSKENYDDYPMLTPKSLYGGSAGVGLFYLRLYQVTKKDEYLEEAEKRGDIKPGDTLLDYTSGNTGIGEATFANAKGYKLVIVIQPGVSKERSQILKALGATLLQVTDVPGFPELLTNGLSMEGLDRVFKAFAKQNGWYYLNQCADINNSLAHVKGTGPEIWEATGGKVDYVVQLVGTGGTLSGLAKYFREKNSDVKIIGAQPAEQSKKNPNFPDRNTIDGVLNFNGVPQQNYPPLFTAFNTKWDECFDVVAEDAYETGRKLVSTEGFFVGQSAGAALWVASEIAKRPEAKGKNIVVILADNAFKYLSTNMYK